MLITSHPLQLFSRTHPTTPRIGGPNSSRLVFSTTRTLLMSPSASGSSRSLDSTSALHSRVSVCAVAGADAIVARTVARTAAARTGRPVRKAAGRRRSLARGMARTPQVVAPIAPQVAPLPGPAGGGPMDGNRLAFRPLGPQVYTFAQRSEEHKYERTSLLRRS